MSSPFVLVLFFLLLWLVRQYDEQREVEVFA